MLDRYAAQALVDGMAALALGAEAPMLGRQGTGSPLRVRLGFVVGGLCLFFATRATFEALAWPALGVTVLLIVCVLPLATLILAEGVLRRHAPVAMKALVTGGGLLTATTIAVTRGVEPASSAGLGVYVILSLAGVTALLLLRDRSSLSPQENASADTLLAVAALVVLLTVSDFLRQAPIALSGLGATVLAFTLAAAPRFRRESLRLAGDLMAMGLLAVAGAVLGAGPLGLTTAMEKIRFGVLLLTLLLTAGTLVGALRRREGRALHDFAASLAKADTGSLDAFLGTVAAQPLLSGLRVAEGHALSDYDVGGLAAAMAVRPIWTEASLGEDPATPARSRDELADLMARTEATHAMMISPSPLRVALLTLPDLGPAEETEVHLALFHKLASIAAGNSP